MSTMLLLAVAVSGFWHLDQADGKWSMVDPDGAHRHLIGIDHVCYGGHPSRRSGKARYRDANRRHFPSREAWAADAAEKLKAWGFNLLGTGCDRELEGHGFAHTRFLWLGEGLTGASKGDDLAICKYANAPGTAFPNVFAPGFQDYCERRARQSCAPLAEDRNLVGYFLDNELAWWGRGDAESGLFLAVARLPRHHSARQALSRFLVARGLADDPGKASAEVREAFLGEIAERYFRCATEAIRRADPNHLVLGCRFAGLDRAAPIVWKTAGRYCDLVTFNLYPWADLDRQEVYESKAPGARTVAEALSDLHRLTGRPLMVTEWSFTALDSGLPCLHGAGQRFRTQSERAKAIGLFAELLLSSPCVPAFDYFMWVDEPSEGISDAFPEDSNYGLVNEGGEPYEEVVRVFRDLTAKPRRSQLMAPRPDVPRRTGMTASEFAARTAFPPSNGRVSFAQKDGSFAIENRCGYRLEGAIGKSRVFGHVTWKGIDYGEFGLMLLHRIDGVMRWNDVREVTDVNWSPDGGYLTARASGKTGTRDFAMTVRVTPHPDLPRFLCDVLSVENVGVEPLEVFGVYLREYSPFAVDRIDNDGSLPDMLWKLPFADAWIRAKDGAFYGLASFAPTLKYMRYYLTGESQIAHPDALLASDERIVLQTGEKWSPRGTVWGLVACGVGGESGWARLTNSLDRACYAPKDERKRLSARGKPSRARLIAHAGSQEEAPENTLPAFRLAASRGFGFEMDVQLSADGKVFTAHEGTAANFTGNRTPFRQMPWSEISKIDVGGHLGEQWKGTRPALLDEVLPLVREGRRSYVEIKGSAGVACVKAVREAVARHGNVSPRNLAVISFGKDICREVRRQMPEYDVYYLSISRTQLACDAPSLTADDILKSLREAEATGLDILGDIWRIDEKFVRRIKAAGYSVHAWTVDNPEHVLKLLERGVDTVTTNRGQALMDEFLSCGDADPE